MTVLLTPDAIAVAPADHLAAWDLVDEPDPA
jgi:hypothetical protein